MSFVKPVEGAGLVNENENGEPPSKRSRNENSNKPEPVPEKMETEFKAPSLLPPPMAPPPKGPIVAKKRPPKKSLNAPNANQNAAKPAINEPKHKHAETAEEKARTLYISNLDYLLADPESHVREIFLGCGEIEDIRLVRNGALFRGYGYVLFAAKEGADNGILRDRTKIKGWCNTL